jgi:hypothetical protein
MIETVLAPSNVSTALHVRSEVNTQSIPEHAPKKLSNSSIQLPRTKKNRQSSNSVEFFAYPSGFGIRVDARSHLEVFDKKHRYGKNLRKYYNEWVRLRIDMQFFEWLESPELIEVSIIVDFHIF